MDRADLVPILEELYRLRSIYSRSRSFERYSSALSWLIVGVAAKSCDIPEPVLDALMQSTLRWDESHLRPCLGYFYLKGQPLPKAYAYVIAKSDERTTKGAVFRRHEQKFRALFEQKYTGRYGAGLKLTAAKRLHRGNYHPASATLRDDPQLGRVISDTLDQLPDVLAITSQFADLAKIWQECQEELRSFDRAAKAGGGVITCEAYESLPESLRIGEHPESAAWFGLWEKAQQTHGFPIAEVGELAVIKGMRKTANLTKGQGEKLLKTADCLGIGVEPDIRLSGGKYEWDDKVALFFRDSDNLGDEANYQSASLMLGLGLTVAHADASLDQVEIDHITKHLEDRFTLSPDESKRLHCRVELSRKSFIEAPRITAAIKAKLPHKDRKLIGSYLVGIAAADHHVSAKEKLALEQLYRSIGLEASELAELLKPFAPKESDQPQEVDAGNEPAGFVLDRAAISRIWSETREVSVILHQAMSEHDESNEFVTTQAAFTASEAAVARLPAAASTTSPPGAEHDFDGLAVKYHVFLAELLSSHECNTEDARQVAARCGVMLNGAAEVINEWSYEKYGDQLIDLEPEFLIHSHIIQRQPA